MPGALKRFKHGVHWWKQGKRPIPKGPKLSVDLELESDRVGLKHQARPALGLALTASEQRHFVGYVGSWLSHMRAVRQGIEEGAPFVVVLEDDQVGPWKVVCACVCVCVCLQLGLDGIMRNQKGKHNELFGGGTMLTHTQVVALSGLLQNHVCDPRVSL